MKKNLFVSVAIFLVFMLSWVPNAIADDDLYFPDFASPAGLSLVGNATQVGNVLRLTSAATNKAGAAWFITKQEVEDDFTTTFEFQITNLGGIDDPQGQTGADGIAFVIQNSSAGVFALGSAGGNIGYTGIVNSLAVEFDTWPNSEFSDPNNSHISVHTRGTLANTVNHSASLGSTSAIPNMSDGNPHTVIIDYEDETLNISLDGSHVLTVPVDLEAILNLDDDEEALVGFTAATGAAFENHDILEWSFEE